MRSNINIDLSHQNQLDFDNRKPKVPIKFNRKRESIKIEKKKSQQNIMTTQRICFISPEKANLNYLDKIKSNQKQKKDTNFLAFDLQKQQSYIITSNTNSANNGNDSILSLYQELQDEHQRQKQSKIYQYIKIMQSLYLELDSIKAENKKLQQRIKSLESLQQFLIERQTFIGQITDKNIHLNQKNMALQCQKQRVVKQLSEFKKKYDKQKDMILRKQFQSKQQYQLQRQEIEMIIEINYKMHQQIEASKVKYSKMKKLARSRKTEQVDVESQNANRRKLIKSKSGQALLNNMFLNNIVDINQSDTRITKVISDKSFCQDQSNLKSVKSQEYDMVHMKARSMDGDELFERFNMRNDLCDCQPKISQLQQKIRYLQIEIDILKKIKFDNAVVKADYEKIKAQNDNLKDYNKKLMKKVSSLKINSQTNINTTQKTSKHIEKNNFSDSSLQLSLSPKKR